MESHFNLFSYYYLFSLHISTMFWNQFLYIICHKYTVNATLIFSPCLTLFHLTADQVLHSDDRPSPKWLAFTTISQIHMTDVWHACEKVRWQYTLEMLCVKTISKREEVLVERSSIQNNNKIDPRNFFKLTGFENSLGDLFPN